LSISSCNNLVTIPGLFLADNAFLTFISRYISNRY
jgi:hypothetical protein